MLSCSVTLDIAKYIQPISGTHPPMANDSYVVQEGDTFDSIAQKVYGDAQFGAQIAAANGQDESATLIAGQVIELPQFIPSQDSSNSYDGR